MSAWAIAGQSLGLIVGGAGVGIAAATSLAAWYTFHRVEDLQDALLAERLARYETVAQLGTCQATRDALRDGREIDADIPLDLGDFVVPDSWRVRPPERPTD